MARKVRNVGASVRARLLQRAQDDGSDFLILLIRYAMERLLYRLSQSPYRDRFILKGALLLATWVDNPLRPTRDLDLLGQGDSDPSVLAEIFRSLCAQSVADDGVTFDAAKVNAAVIRDGQVYGGVRVTTVATIDKALVPIQVDVGFGDAITPAPVEIAYPVLLDGPPVHIRAYPVETVIAEKLEALTSLGLANTRLKDFYDLWFIAETFPLDREIVTQALRRTFERRNTPWATTMPDGLSDAFVASRDRQWRAYLARDQIAAAPAAFADVVALIRAFLQPIITATGPDLDHWPPGGPWRARS